MPLSISPLSRSPASSRSSSLAGKPRKPSPLRRSSTPEDSEQLRMSTATRHVEDAAGHENGENHETDDVGGTKVQQSSRDQETQMRRSSEGSAASSASTEDAPFNSKTSSLSESNQSTSSHDITPNSSTRSSFDENTVTSTESKPSHQLPATKTISNSKYSLPPIRPTPKFPHSTPIRPLKPLSTVSGSGGGVGSLSSVPHAGAGVGQAPQRQKIIVPSKSWKACFDLNLTQKELARFD